MVGSQWALGPVVAACVLLAGCSGGADGSSLTVRVPATAAVAPASPTVKPVGTVTPLGAAVQASVIDPSTRVLAVLADSPNRVLLLNVDDLAAAPRAVALSARAAQVTLSAPGGPLFVAVPGALLRVDQRTGAVATTKVDADVRSAVELPNGKTAVGTGDGQVLVLGSDGAVTHRIKGMAEASVLASTPQGLVALDRKQTAAISVDLDTSTLGAGIRVGEGATNAVTDRFGRVLVTDTDGGELLELSAGPVMLRQRFPVPGAPYALAYDPKTDLAWVTLTATNQVVGYDVAGGEPVERYRFGTLPQPDAVAVDSSTGAVLVASASGAGLQRIAPAGGSR
jgi:sugar lactone lactonase YvrE